MRYRTYSYLLDAASWTGCTTELLDGGAALIRHPDFTLWVSIPFIDTEEGGAARLMSGKLSPPMAEALGIEVDTWVDDLKINILCTSFEWVPAPLWMLFVSPLLAWAIEGKNKTFTWPKGRSWKPWHRSFWHGGWHA
jgi:hypothetical protein